MKVVVAVDSFKGSLSTFQSGAAVTEGIKEVYPKAEVTVCPLADGGEGTVAAIVSATDGKICKATVTGPLGEPIVAEYGIIPQTRTAVIEMSSAAGITLVKETERDPLKTTTYGVGELIAHAVKENGCRKFIIGIGGSATNDGGVGMLQALGFEFLDADGNAVPFGARGLSVLAEIKTDKALKELGECEFYVACDVKNPLCGENGCSAVYGAQKGATPQMIKDMDGWLTYYASRTEKLLGRADAEYPGAGAAGGLGFAFLSYLNGKLESGIGLVMRITRLEERLKDADFVVTGEGRLDGQSKMGKAPVGVAKAAKKYGKTVLAFSGCVTADARQCNEHGIDAFFPIVRTPCSLEAAMDVFNAYANLKNTVEQVFRLIRVLRKD
ncbi:MAG: glycerate kinase [Clostridia bacterium]|nr:glycerate kinase [Clostridia bacterium]